MNQIQILNEIAKYNISDESYNEFTNIDDYINHLIELKALFVQDLDYYIANELGNNQKAVVAYMRIKKIDIEKIKSTILAKNKREIRHKNFQKSHIEIIDTLISDISNRLSIILNEGGIYTSESEINKNVYDNLLSDYDDLLTITDLCQIFRVSRITINNWKNEGRITPIHGGKPRYAKEPIKKLILNRHPELLNMD